MRSPSALVRDLEGYEAEAKYISKIIARIENRDSDALDDFDALNTLYRERDALYRKIEEIREYLSAYRDADAGGYARPYHPDRHWWLWLVEPD